MYRNKYKSKKVEIDGIKFDSKKEAARYSELKLLEKVGAISNLELQKPFILIPTQREPSHVSPRGRTIQGKVIERSVRYIADFAYTDNETGQFVVEDTKGYKQGNAYTIFSIKRKLMLYVHNIKIQEI